MSKKASPVAANATHRLDRRRAAAIDFAAEVGGNKRRRERREQRGGRDPAVGRRRCGERRGRRHSRRRSPCTSVKADRPAAGADWSDEKTMSGVRRAGDRRAVSAARDARACA